MWNKQLVLDKVSIGDNVLVVSDADLSYDGILVDCDETCMHLGKETSEGMLTIFLEYELIDSIGRFEKRAKINSGKKNDS